MIFQKSSFSFALRSVNVEISRFKMSGNLLGSFFHTPHEGSQGHEH